MAPQSTTPACTTRLPSRIRWDRAFAHFTLALALGASIGLAGPRAALAQPSAASSAKASAKPSPAAKSKDSKAKPGAASSASPPTASSQQPAAARPPERANEDADDDSESDELPPGHPLVDAE